MKKQPFTRLGAVAALSLATLLGTTACSPASSDGDTLTVLAASSLTETFGELAKTFERDHPGVHVDLVLASSSSLAEQVRQGAPGDVLATADEESMGSVVAAGDTDGRPHTFASNRIVLAVPAGPDREVRRVGDLEKPGVRYVVCVPEAPCGHVARAALDENGISAPPASEEPDVKSVLTKLESGEADAGFVYITDVLASGDSLRSIDVSSSPTTSTSYAIAPLADAQSSGLAADWVDLVLSPQGRQVLRDAGFGQP